jgi:hypothetical protein
MVLSELTVYVVRSKASRISSSASRCVTITDLAPGTLAYRKGVALFLMSGCFAATRRRRSVIVAQLRFEFHYSYEGYFLNILATALSTSCMFFCEFFSFKVP